jgi:hypothetical protein
MSENVIANNDNEREKLLPVVTKILGLYVIIMTIAYFAGNMIYQIP